jgi:hypothetical protein
MSPAEQELRGIFDKICAEHGVRITDKNRGAHNFMELYSQIFAPYRQTATTMFEIGVNRGGSLRGWHEYFKNAKIYGCDIRQRGSVSGCDRATLIQLDQSNNDALLAFANQYGPFDIGIDDGSHVWSHQILTFETLWPFIKPGGLYVVEDTCTSYSAWINTEGANRAHMKYDDSATSCVEYFKSLVDHLNFNGEDYEKNKDWSVYQKTVDWLAFRNDVLWIKKKA